MTLSYITVICIFVFMKYFENITCGACNKVTKGMTYKYQVLFKLRVGSTEECEHGTVESPPPILARERVIRCDDCLPNDHNSNLNRP